MRSRRVDTFRVINYSNLFALTGQRVLNSNLTINVLAVFWANINFDLLYTLLLVKFRNDMLLDVITTVLDVKRESGLDIYFLFGDGSI